MVIVEYIIRSDIPNYTQLAFNFSRRTVTCSPLGVAKGATRLVDLLMGHYLAVDRGHTAGEDHFGMLSA